MEKKWVLRGPPKLDLPWAARFTCQVNTERTLKCNKVSLSSKQRGQNRVDQKCLQMLFALNNILSWHWTYSLRNAACSCGARGLRGELQVLLNIRSFQDPSPKVLFLHRGYWINCFGIVKQLEVFIHFSLPMPPEFALRLFSCLYFSHFSSSFSFPSKACEEEGPFEGLRGPLMLLISSLSVWLLRDLSPDKLPPLLLSSSRDGRNKKN